MWAAQGQFMPVTNARIRTFEFEQYEQYANSRLIQNDHNSSLLAANSRLIQNDFITCDVQWIKFEEKCYKYYADKTNWDVARDLCKRDTNNPTATLASVHDIRTNDFLTSLSGGESWTWIGGYQGPQLINWKWTDESPFPQPQHFQGIKSWATPLWAPNQPDNGVIDGLREDYLGINFGGPGQWNDFDEGHQAGRLCQYDLFTCEQGWKIFNHTGKCYRYFDDWHITWHGSHTLCTNSKKPNANLASVHDKKTNNFLKSLTDRWAWIGGFQDNQDKWQWSDGTPFDESAKWIKELWAPGQPDNAGGREDFLGIDYNGWWNDFNDPGHRLGPICQYDLPGSGQIQIFLH